MDSLLDTALNTRSTVSRALAAAEELLRSGGFALVVVTGVPGGVDAELVRLSRVAREGGAALVVVEHAEAGAGAPRPSAVAAARLKVESWYRPEAHVWRRGVFGEPVEVESMGIGARVTGTGWLKHVNLQLPVLHHAYRLSLDPGLVDRRGVQPAELRRHERAVESSRPGFESIGLALEGVVAAAVEQAVQPGRDGVECAGGGGLAGAGEAGGGAARGGAAAADRGVWPGLGGRAWTGRAPLRREAVRAAG